MDKIKALLEKAGVKSELAARICESMDSYKTTLRERYDEEYAAKVEQAKTVCIEETEAHKRDLARRLQIFCETKGARIEAQLAKQSALNESEALTKLTQVSALVQGLEPNGTPSRDITAVVEKLKRQAQVATEEKNQAIALANRKTAIAEKVLKRNRELTTHLESVKEQTTGTKRPVSESKGRRPRQRKRIDQSRQGGQPRSTRATLTESQDQRPPKRSNKPHVTNTGTGGNGFNIGNIAASLDEDLV
jgi:hypothetical protein